MITQLFPEARKFESIEDCVDNSFVGQECRAAYAEKSIIFLDALSKSLLGESKSRIFPEVVALAFWLRKGNIRKMLSGVNACEDVIIVPRGVAFHIAPSNVDIMFLYSWALSLLGGNINI